MTRRKWRIKRPMAVPANWQGTPDHFYHFLLGYFMPVILWQERTGAHEFAVRDCGPMNPWFELTRPGTEVELMPPGIMLERVLSHRQERVILRDWDNPTRFHRRSIAQFSRTVLDRVASPSERRSETPRITVLDRRPSADYYRSDAADSHGSGADRRSVSNVDAIASALGPLGTVTVVDTAVLPPAEQVRALAGTDLLVAQHGAGMANMVWMPAGSAVVEIQPPLPPTIDAIFSNLASACGLSYYLVGQAGEHADAPVEAVVAASSRLVTEPGAHIPTMTGTLPIRLLRRLPRRL